MKMNEEEEGGRGGNKETMEMEGWKCKEHLRNTRGALSISEETSKRTEQGRASAWTQHR